MTSSGCSCWHGGHQLAKKFTTTHRPRSASRSKARLPERRAGDRRRDLPDEGRVDLGGGLLAGGWRAAPPERPPRPDTTARHPAGGVTAVRRGRRCGVVAHGDGHGEPAGTGSSTGSWTCSSWPGIGRLVTPSGPWATGAHRVQGVARSAAPVTGLRPPAPAPRPGRWAAGAARGRRPGADPSTRRRRRTHSHDDEGLHGDADGDRTRPRWRAGRPRSGRRRRARLESMAGVPTASVFRPELAHRRGVAGRARPP